MFSIFSQFIFGTSNFLSGRAPAKAAATGSSTASAKQAQSQNDKHNQQYPASASIKSASWRDKSLCFDLRSHELELNRGEQLIGCFYPIEDAKGNSSEFGVMKLTNMRLIWICLRKRRVNLSIGWRTVSLVYEQNLKDPLGGSRTSLFVLTKFESTKYEFMFNKPTQLDETNLNWPQPKADDERDTLGFRNNFEAAEQLRKFCSDKSTGAQITHLSPDHLDDPFDAVSKVWQAYKQTQLFRHCRSNLPNLFKPDSNQSRAIDGDLGNQLSKAESGRASPSRMSIARTLKTRFSDIESLPSEEMLELLPDIVLSESRAVKYVGTLVLTDVRIIWFDSELPMRNLSIPYIRG